MGSLFNIDEEAESVTQMKPKDADDLGEKELR